MNTDALTDRQKEYLVVFASLLMTKGRPPTLQELATRMGVGANAARNVLQMLVKNGFLRTHERGATPTYRLTTYGCKLAKIRQTDICPNCNALRRKTA